MLGSNMTDFSLHLSWGFVRRGSFVVRRCGPAACARSLFRFEYTSCQVGEGRSEGTGCSLSCCKQGARCTLQKVENTLHSCRGDSVGVKQGSEPSARLSTVFRFADSPAKPSHHSGLRP